MRNSRRKDSVVPEPNILQGERGGGTDLDDPTDEYIIALVIDSVLQHHFVHHGNEDLVLKKREKRGERQ